LNIFMLLYLLFCLTFVGNLDVMFDQDLRFVFWMFDLWIFYGFEMFV
jgi:hypothetical protein